MSATSLIGQQVIGWKSVNNKWVLDDDVISILKIMYPDFRLVKGVFDIYPEDSFIYIGDIKWINSVKDKSNPHIIVATSGIDLLDRQTLLECVFDYIGKPIPKYFEERELLKLWDDKTFYYNLKFILLLGIVPDKELSNNSLFLEIINNLSNLVKLIPRFFELLDSTGDVGYLESNFITFINNSKNINITNSNNSKVYSTRLSFMNSHGGNINYAVYRLLDSNVDSGTLRLLNFIFDLTRGVKKS